MKIHDKYVLLYLQCIRSHDGFVENENGLLVPESNKSNYACQQKVFNDLGRGVLQNAFEGNVLYVFALI